MGTSAQQNLSYRQLCKMLTKWREQADISQRELSRILGKSPNYAHKCETGDRRIDPIELIHWCRACNIDPAKAIKQLAKDVK